MKYLIQTISNFIGKTAAINETIADGQSLSSDIKSLSNVQQCNQGIRKFSLSEHFSNSIDKFKNLRKNLENNASDNEIVETAKVQSVQELLYSSQTQELVPSSSSYKNNFFPNDNDNCYESKDDSSAVSPRSAWSSSTGHVFNGASSSCRRSVDFSSGSRLQIDWSDITINAIKKEDCILGEGTFGVVIKGIWRKNKLQIDVAIKLLTKNNVQKISNGNVSFQDMSEFAWKEVSVMKEAELCLVGTECIVKVYGVAEGILPEQITNFLNLPFSHEGVGVVMRYEGGGSLENILHTVLKPLSLSEKIRILIGVATALVELHSAGIIHADIKSSNVLLSHHNPPEIRLADFGMSLLKDPEVGDGTGYSTLSLTNHRRGTPVYSAPETLFNPFAVVGVTAGQGVAQSSRKTDMYSFGILTWEVFARKKPFQDMKNETMLCGKVHRGIRPPLDQIPVGTPPELISLIESCWDKERSKRKSAVEVLSILQYNMDRLTAGHFDIFFSHAWVSKPLICHVYQMLTKMGYRVWYDQNDMGHDMEESMRRGIASSTVVIACINTTYQLREACMFELREASSKPILALVSEDEPLTWATQEVQDLCKLKSRLYVNIAEVARLAWNEEQGPSTEMFENLTKALEPMSKLLKELGCTPSLISNTGELARTSSLRISKTIDLVT